MKKIITLAAVTGLILAAVTGCQKKDGGLTPVTLNEVAHSIFYAPQYAAIELGYFEEEGIELTLVNGAGAHMRAGKRITPSISPSSPSAPAISSSAESRKRILNGKILRGRRCSEGGQAVCPRWSLNTF